VGQALTTLPKSLADNSQANLLSLCDEFIEEVKNYTNGKPNDNPKQGTFLKDASSHYRALKTKINRTRPQFEIAPDGTYETTPALGTLLNADVESGQGNTLLIN
jgi:hypothetical protein